MRVNVIGQLDHLLAGHRGGEVVTLRLSEEDRLVLRQVLLQAVHRLEAEARTSKRSARRSALFRRAEQLRAVNEQLA
jgi:hypothetical protein